MHTSLIQILKINTTRTGTSAKTGNKWELQDAECLLLADDGSVGQVGVLLLPNELRGKVEPGTYTASFALGVDRDRRVTAYLTALTPVPVASSASPRQSKSAA